MSGTIPLFNPFSSEFRSDPYTIYQYYRLYDPIHWGAAPTPTLPGSWYITRYADVVTVLKDPRFGRELRRILPPDSIPPLPDALRPFVEMAGQWMLFRDPPDHTRLRTLVNKAFTPAAVMRLRPRIEAIANGLVDSIIPVGGMDLIADYAFPLPVTVIAEMLGVPATNRQQLREWSIALAAAIDVRQSLEVTARAGQVTLALMVFLQSLIAAKRQQPDDDLLSALIAAEEQGERLGEAELIAMCILLLVAGHETTVNLIGNGMLALLRHSDQLELWRQNPALSQTAIEELLRFDAPVQMTFRFVMEDVELDGKLLRKGDSVGIILGAANRDPAQFPDPDRLDLRRTDNRHHAFGAGIHYCLGAPLARLEGQIAIHTLLQCLPNIQMQTSEPIWREMISFRGLRSLPISF